MQIKLLNASRVNNSEEMAPEQWLLISHTRTQPGHLSGANGVAVAVSSPVTLMYDPVAATSACRREGYSLHLLKLAGPHSVCVCVGGRHVLLYQ